MFYRGHCTLAILEHLQTLEIWCFLVFEPLSSFLKFYPSKCNLAIDLGNCPGTLSLSSSSLFSVSSIRSSTRCPIHFKTICKWYRDQNYWWENYFFPLEKGIAERYSFRGGEKEGRHEEYKIFMHELLDDLKITSDKKLEKGEYPTTCLQLSLSQ